MYQIIVGFNFKNTITTKQYNDDYKYFISYCEHLSSEKFKIQTYSSDTWYYIICTTLCGRIKGKGRDTNVMYPLKEGYK